MVSSADAFLYVREDAMRTCHRLLFVLVLLSGCNTTESDWKHAKDANTVAAYSGFLAKHPQGNHVSDANAAIENLDWAMTKDANTVPAYEDFVRKHPAGQFAETAKTALMDVRWADAKRTETTQSYKSFLDLYPSSPYTAEATARIEALSITKADSISITDGGRGDIQYGKFTAKMQLTPIGTLGLSPEMTGSKKVFIFRNLPIPAEEAQKLGIKVGAAYLWQGNVFRFIRNIDLNLSDKALCAQFGVSSGNSWHRTFWSVPGSASQK
jgi:hypothetical protein